VLQSQVIDVAGVFAGAAVRGLGHFRFIAVDPRVEELDGSEWQSLPDMRRVVGCLLTTGRLPQRQPAASPGKSFDKNTNQGNTP
jgi:hypothetical protein